MNSVDLIFFRREPSPRTKGEAFAFFGDGVNVKALFRQSMSEIGLGGGSECATHNFTVIVNITAAEFGHGLLFEGTPPLTFTGNLRQQLKKTLNLLVSET